MSKHTIESFAEMLHIRTIGEEITHAEELEAKEAGLVVIYGYSDDTAIIAGAIDDTAGVYDGGAIHLSDEGYFEENACDCKWHKAAKDKCHKVEAVWHYEGNPCWTYKTDIPHATFDIMEDDEVFCRGIVFEMKSIEAPNE